MRQRQEAITVADVRTAATPACRAFGVRRLAVFGSCVRGSTTRRSDVDLLVEFHKPRHEAARRYFGLLHSLEDTLQRSVDLLTKSTLRNPYFARRVARERVTIYEG